MVISQYHCGDINKMLVACDGVTRALYVKNFSTFSSHLLSSIITRTVYFMSTCLLGREVSQQAQHKSRQDMCGWVPKQKNKINETTFLGLGNSGLVSQSTLQCQVAFCEQCMTFNISRTFVVSKIISFNGLSSSFLRKKNMCNKICKYISIRTFFISETYVTTDKCIIFFTDLNYVSSLGLCAPICFHSCH